jgi:uncharacterized repeat protein (TIGR03833 family)
MRDVRVRDQLAPGLRVKIVQPKDEESGLTTEGAIAEVISQVEFDPDGIEVRLTTGETGRVLRVWAPVAEKRAVDKLPTYDAPRPSKAHFKLVPSDAEVEKAAAEVLGKADLDFMIEQKAQGHSGDALRQFGIRSEDLEERARELLDGVDDDELDRRMGKNRP